MADTTCPRCGRPVDTLHRASGRPDETAPFRPSAFQAGPCGDYLTGAEWQALSLALHATIAEARRG